MSEHATIPVKTRVGSGTGSARAVRREGMIPGIVYGAGGDPTPIKFALRDIEKHYQTGRFTSTLFTLDIEGEKLRVIPREVSSN